MSERTSGSPTAQGSAAAIPLVYLDYNCFQRGFHDPAHVRIQMEALACQEVFARSARSETALAKTRSTWHARLKSEQGVS
jgi:hypothetical protein